MVRTYQRKYTNTRNGKSHLPYLRYSEDNLRKAIEAVQNRSLRLKEAAENYNIPISTLSRKYRNKNCTQEKAGHPTLFSKEEERIFIENIQLLSHWGFPLDSTDLRVYAQKYLNKAGITKHCLENNMPGVDWARNFLNRHKNEISYRTASNISSDRAKTTGQVIDDFFSHYAKSVEGVSPDCLINYDETNLTDDPGSKKYIFKRGCKYPERVINSSKSSISLMFAGTADGQTLPIYVVYKAEHIWDQWLEGGPEGTRYNRSRSGWFDTVCFEDWFHTIIVPYAKKKPGRKVLIGDNLSSHFSQSVLKTCGELNIMFICLPPKTTHLLQPLDVAFYAPLKKYWRDVLTKWKKTGGLKHKTLVKSSFPSLLNKLKSKLMENNVESINLIAGFDKCGLYPINPDRPKSRLPQNVVVSEEHIENTASLAIIDMLQEMRSPANTTGQTTRKKKCNIPPGMSITSEDLKRDRLEKSKQLPKRRNTQKLTSLDEDTDKEELNVLDTQPSAGPSGLCNAYAYDSDSTHCSSVDERSQNEIITETIKKSEIGENISIKGKGKGKKSKPKLENNQTKISNLEKPAASAKNVSSKSKRKRSNPVIKKRQMKISDLDNLDLDLESIERLKASIKAEKAKKKKTKRESYSDTTSLSDNMSIHSDSDIIDIDFAEISSDGDEERNNDIRQPTVAENIFDVDDKLISLLCIPDSSVEQKTDGNLKTNYNNTKVENVINKTMNYPNSSATICDEVGLPAPSIPQKVEDIIQMSDCVNKLFPRSCVSESSIEEKTVGNLKTNYNDTKLEYVIDKTDNDPNNSATICDDLDLPAPVIQKNSNEMQKDESKLHGFLTKYAVNDHVLVRYCDAKKCKYYVGLVENIKIYGQVYNYTVNYFKTVKKPQLAFRITKKIDRDEVNDVWIVKKVDLKKNPINNKEFLLVEKSDETYF